MSYTRTERSFTESEAPRHAHLENSKCGCGFPVARLISKTEKNPNRSFIKCAKDQCGLWSWEDEFNLSGPSVVVGYGTPPEPNSEIPLPANLKRKRSSSPMEHQAPSKYQRIEEATSILDIDLPEIGSHFSDSEDEIISPSTPVNKTAPPLPEDVGPPVTPKKAVTFAAIRYPSNTPSSSSNRSPTRRSTTTPQSRNSMPPLQDDLDDPFVAITPTRTNLKPQLERSPTQEIESDILQTPKGPKLTSGGKSDSRLLLEQMEKLHDQLASRIATQDRKSVADAKSIEAKVQRIKTLEDEVARLTRENQVLKRENQTLRDQRQIF
ncbi:hypothetical protein FRC18_006565 [Serendipita sp. 400]|nr:hypothetical protein FRC18_006565 [Serendipita sp. 400]